MVRRKHKRFYSDPSSLSAYLYEHTKDDKYLSAAKLSADFVLSQLTNGNVILDTMRLTTCNKSPVLLTSNSAYTIYGLSALAAIDSDGYASKYGFLWIVGTYSAANVVVGFLG